MATVGRVVVLLWVDILAIYAMYLLMAYLTNVWGISFTHAAAIVNIFWGVVLVLPVLLIYLVDTIFGHYWMLLLSSIAYSVGMGFLSMSTPPVLANATGTCSDYKAECIGQTQKALFYTALPLIAFGLAGHMTSFNTFMGEQLSDVEGDNLDASTIWRFVSSILAVFIVTFAAVMALPYIKPWSIRFGIPAICTLVATLLFISGSCSYKYFPPAGSPITIFIRVFVAALLKLFYRVPRDHKELYELRHPQLYNLPHTNSLTCLDKAAVVIPGPPLQEQVQHLWRLCSMTEVEETKTILRMIPVWLTFILCGVVSAIGFTYFVEQLDHLNPKVGRLKVPTLVLLWFYEQSQDQFANIYLQFENFLAASGVKKLAPPVGIAASMVLAVLCCITAARVEDRRLGVVSRHGLTDKPEETVPMTMFWLLPQFILLGGFQGVFNCSAIGFFADQSPPETRRYLPFFLNGVFGLGVLGSVLSVFVAGKVSERGGRRNWFQDELNVSRLDKYYWTLAWLMAVNLAVFTVVALLYRYREAELQEEQEEQQEPEFEGMEEPYDVRCCCC